MVRSDSLVVGIPDCATVNLLTALKTSFQITLAPLSIWKKEHWQDGSSAWGSMGACELSARGC